MEVSRAYYYSFKSTGVDEIDAILNAVASAGKAYHHTDMWNDDSDGPSKIDIIQRQANEAANAITVLREAKK